MKTKQFYGMKTKQFRGSLRVHDQSGEFYDIDGIYEAVVGGNELRAAYFTPRGPLPEGIERDPEADVSAQARECANIQGWLRTLDWISEHRAVSIGYLLVADETEPDVVVWIGADGTLLGETAGDPLSEAELYEGWPVDLSDALEEYQAGVQVAALQVRVCLPLDLPDKFRKTLENITKREDFIK
jgi:hypothetical protein